MPKHIFPERVIDIFIYLEHLFLDDYGHTILSDELLVDLRVFAGRRSPPLPHNTPPLIGHRHQTMEYGQSVDDQTHDNR